MDSAQSKLISLILNSDINQVINSLHEYKAPDSLMFENMGERSKMYMTQGTLPSTSFCTQCPATCCFASYSTPSIKQGLCITNELEDMINYH